MDRTWMITPPDKMRAWRIPQFGDFKDVLNLESCPPPAHRPDHTAIRVRAIGLNFLDILSIAGKYQVKGELPFIPGVEAAGQVVETGPESPFQIGDSVMTVADNACAEFMVARPENTFIMPDGMSYADAAAFQLTYQTAYMALVRRARLKPGEWILVHAGAGGVGTAAIQIGRSLGARVIATAGSEEKLGICRMAGAETVINYRDGGFVERVMDVTDGRGADVIFDPVGGAVFDESTQCVAFEGRIITIGFASGRIPSIAANRILLKNMDVIGVFWGNYKHFAPQRIARTQSALYVLWEEGKIRPIVYRKYAFEALPAALSALAGRKSFGKIVLNGPE